MAPLTVKGTSRKVTSFHASYRPNGMVITRVATLGPRQMAAAKNDLRLRRRSLFDNSTGVECETLEEFGGSSMISSNGTGMDELVSDPLNTTDDVEGWMTDDNEDIQTAYDDLTEGVHEIHSQFTPRPHDSRTRQDRVERHNRAWDIMYADLVEAHLLWASQGAPQIANHHPCHPPIKVMELYESRDIQFPLDEHWSLNVTMARHGYIGTAPLHPSMAISTKVLEFLRALTVRCPQLSIQAFVKALCELHLLAYHPSLRNKVSRALDVYLEVHRRIDHRIATELRRDGPKWRLQNACPACTHTLPDEPSMEFSMFVAMDGNESLKRVYRARREKNIVGQIINVENIERDDSRTIESDMYVSEADVNRFQYEVKRCQMPKRSEEKNLTPNAVGHVFPADAHEGRPIDGVEQLNPCVQRWTNLSDECTKKRLGIFRETGIFLAVCRHGTVLVMCDMVQSGELAKYGLALTNELLDTFGSRLMIGYDIGCGFSTTAGKSALVAPKLRTLKGRFCVGSFHGHAHCRTCQLDWHPQYIQGCGLEDFETCERVFSRSNALASSTRHASSFHCRQLILRWFETWNKEKYAECSKFLHDNYVQALGNIAVLSEYLAHSMKVLRIPSEHTFVLWHQAERDYLLGLKHEPEVDILRIEYLETLIKLKVADEAWRQSSSQWMGADLSDLQGVEGYARATASSRRLETARARSLETLLTLQKAVQDLEVKLEIDDQWKPHSPEWIATQSMIDTRKYQSALDRLEGLVVARLFELTKAHQSGTGYKLRKHISKALKSRSEAIRTAVKNYNTAAAMLKPPRPTLDVQTVLDYVYLAQFDLLRESRHQLPDLPWSRPAEREAASAFFKLQRSREEIIRLNIEIHRLWTWMDKEEEFLSAHVQHLECTDPPLSSFVHRSYLHLVAINKVHRWQLEKVEGLDGFTGRRHTVHPNLQGHEAVAESDGEDGIEADVEAMEVLEATVAAMAITD